MNSRRIISILLRLGFIVLIAAALYVTLWREGLHAIPALEHWIQTKINESVEQEVSFNGINGYLKGFKPTIIVENVEVYEQQNHIFSANKIVFELNTFESLKTGRFAFQKFAVMGGRLTVERPTQAKEPFKLSTLPKFASRISTYWSDQAVQHFNQTNQFFSWLMQQKRIVLRNFYVQGVLDDSIFIPRAVIQHEAEAIFFDTSIKVFRQQHNLQGRISYPDTFESDHSLGLASLKGEFYGNGGVPLKQLALKLKNQPRALAYEYWLDLAPHKLPELTAILKDQDNSITFQAYRPKTDHSTINSPQAQPNALKLGLGLSAPNSLTQSLVGTGNIIFKDQWLADFDDTASIEQLPLPQIDFHWQNVDLSELQNTLDELKLNWSPSKNISDPKGLVNQQSPSQQSQPRLDGIVDFDWWFHAKDDKTGDPIKHRFSLAVTQLSLDNTTANNPWQIAGVDVIVEGQTAQLNPVSLWQGQIGISSAGAKIQIPQLFPATLEAVEINDGLFQESHKLHITNGDWSFGDDGLNLRLPQVYLRHRQVKAMLGAHYERQIHDDNKFGSLALLAEIQAESYEHYQEYIPVILNEGVVEWLNQAFNGGELSSGRFLFHGPLMKRDKATFDGFAGPDFYNPGPLNKSIGYTPTAITDLLPSFQMHMTGRDLDFSYLPDWPALENATAEVFLGHRRVLFDIQKGNYQGVQLKPSLGQVRVLPQDANPNKDWLAWLDLDLQAEGPLTDGMEFLSSSPVGQKIDSVLSSIQRAKGDFNTRVQLTKPLSPKRQAKLEVNTQVSNGSFWLEPADLLFSQISAQSHFSLTKGLSAKNITGNLWGRPLEGELTATGPVDTITDNSNTNFENLPGLDVTGTIPFEKLATWSKLKAVTTLLSRTNGEAKVRVKVNFPQDLPKSLQTANQLKTPLSVNVFSDLQGVAIDIPGYLKKSSNELRQFIARVEVDDSLRFLLADEDRYFVKGLLNQGELYGTEVYLGNAMNSVDNIFTNWSPDSLQWVSQAQLTAATNVRAAGTHIWVDYPDIDLNEWLAWLQKISPPKPTQNFGYQNNAQQFTLDLTEFAWLTDLNLRAQQLKYTSANTTINLPEFALSAHKEHKGWRINWDGVLLAGKGFLPEKVTNSKPVVFNFDKLLVAQTAAKQQPKELSKQSQVDSTPLASPAQLNTKHSTIPLDVSVQTLGTRNLDDQSIVNYGNLELAVRTDQTGITIPRLRGRLGGLNFNIDGTFNNASKLSEFNVKLDGEELNRGLFDVLDLPPIIKGKNPHGQAMVQWQGLPWQPNLASLNGQASVSIEKGLLTGVSSAASPLKILGLFNFDALLRRFRLDFDDISNQGFGFDRLVAELRFADQKIYNDKLEVDSPSANIKAQGWVDVINDKLYQSCSATIPLSEQLILPAAAMGGLPAAATAYVIEKAIGDQLNQLTRVKWEIQGPLSKPRLKSDANLQK